MDKLNPLYWVNSMHNPLKGNLLYSKVWGSQSHNTQLPSSDIDYLGVYVAYNKDLFGMDGVPETVDGEKPDYQCHEVAKFCKLLMKGNPGIIEMLFTDRMEWMEPKWQVLKDNKRKFLCQQVIKEYLGYCKGQLQKLHADKSLHTKAGEYNTKWAYHMVRLATDARRIAEGGEPIVWKEGTERDMLMEIRLDGWSKDKVTNYTLSQINTIDSLKPWPLPEYGDKTWLNHWLLWVRGFTEYAPE